jgi:hypothetical protein
MTEPETSESASAADTSTATDEDNASADDARITFKQFLETVHPAVAKNISDVWFVKRYQSGGTTNQLALPAVRLHCLHCEGERWFRSDQQEHRVGEIDSPTATFISYLCSDCRSYGKSFSLWISIKKALGEGAAYKYGEHPPFGVPVPNKVLSLFGEDRENFLKGRQCENQGHGVGAFAYYRRVVENHKNEIFDEIIKVCETVGAPQPLIEELGSAKQEVSFTKAMKQIKTALPQGLLIRGHNPLLALHNALSVGLHSESDAKCLEAAHDVRLVLTDLVEKMSLLRQDDSELHGSVQRLIAKKGGT